MCVCVWGGGGGGGQVGGLGQDCVHYETLAKIFLLKSVWRITTDTIANCKLVELKLVMHPVL